MLVYAWLMKNIKDRNCIFLISCIYLQCILLDRRTNAFKYISLLIFDLKVPKVLTKVVSAAVKIYFFSIETCNNMMCHAKTNSHVLNNVGPR